MHQWQLGTAAKLVAEGKAVLVDCREDRRQETGDRRQGDRRQQDLQDGYGFCFGLVTVMLY
jgi:hypothetical protein